MGPLKVHPTNGRYFSNGGDNPLYLTGSHTWNNLQDIWEGSDKIEFDYSAYLDFLNKNGHNFIRLWLWEHSRGMLAVSNPNIWMDPLPYQRTGPGKAVDGLSRFDLTKFNQDYFDRLRSRVEQARNRGIYVSIMLFNGWSVAKNKGGTAAGKPWSTHPFNAANNINGVNGDASGDQSGEETHELRIPAVTAIQEGYVRKVIDTVNDIDNVLYEISNESHSASQQWQYHMVDLIKTYEATKPMQHPVGMTVEYPNGNSNELYTGNADWVSPSGDINNPPTADGTKVVLSDTDHLCGICGDRSWAWKAFTRGENPIFMDAYSETTMAMAQIANDPKWTSLRWNMGYTRSYADRMDLGKVRPQNSLASTRYCLADPGMEYLVYQPNSSGFSLEMAAGEYKYEWFNPATGKVMESGTMTVNNGSEWFTPPFNGDAVLFIESEVTDPPDTITSYPYTEGFENGWGGWVNDSGDDIDWTRNSGPTPSRNTGPSGAYNGSYYIYTEASFPNYPDKTVLLVGPYFDLSDTAGAELTFWYHMYGSAMGTLNIAVSEDHENLTNVWGISGEQGNTWYQANVDLTPYSGKTITIQFTCVTGNSKK